MEFVSWDVRFAFKSKQQHQISKIMKITYDLLLSTVSGCPATAMKTTEKSWSVSIRPISLKSSHLNSSTSLSFLFDISFISSTLSNQSLNGMVSFLVIDKYTCFSVSYDHPDARSRKKSGRQKTSRFSWPKYSCLNCPKLTCDIWGDKNYQIHLQGANAIVEPQYRVSGTEPVKKTDIYC